MSELRKDYILDRFVIIATERAKRPDQFISHDEDKDEVGQCFFCPGNEDKTPPEILRTGMDGQWKMRVFDNKFPAVLNEGTAELQTHNDFFTFADAVGKHEVIVETPVHGRQLWDLDFDDIAQLLNLYDQRIKEISKIDSVQYVIAFKNHKKKAGTSIVHSHSQVIGYNILPEIIRAKEDAVSKYEKCPYCSIIQIEKNSLRRAYENDNAVAFCPYASSSPFELWIFPKKHVLTLDELDVEDRRGLADLMWRALRKLKELNIAYNLFVHYGKKNLHLQIIIVPRTNIRAGFEFGTDTIINTMSPEDAAKFYRGE